MFNLQFAWLSVNNNIPIEEIREILFRAKSAEQRAQGKELRAQGSGLRAQSAGQRAQGTERRAKSSGLRAQGAGEERDLYKLSDLYEGIASSPDFIGLLAMTVDFPGFVQLTS